MPIWRLGLLVNEEGHTFVIKFADLPQITWIGSRLFHVVFQGFDTMLTSHKLRLVVAVKVGPVSKGQHMLIMPILGSARISVRDGVDYIADGGGTTGDLDVVLLCSTCEAAALERATKIGDIIAVEGSIIAIRPGGVE
uniref:WGS project CBMG000000000 data, contig CS5907-c001549 n=1 Tax=Fusarium acuminatum CS5907 TaxID=1318461 RepID=A0A096PFN9_9HYPO|nr:unnamed protein product [Fusarium acuminatum CS5907]